MVDVLIILLRTFAAGLVNGGSVALVYGFILAAIGTMCLAASLAEMASMSAFRSPGALLEGPPDSL